MKEGIAGAIAKVFIRSKLTLLLMFAFLFVGVFSTWLIPREEEPQIEVPVVDIMFGFPGADSREVESTVVAPMEKILSNIPGVEYLYSSSMKEQGMVTVQFYVGQNLESSLVKLYNELMKNLDKMPSGVTPPLVKNRSIDDVPVLALTLWSEEKGDFEIRQLAEVVAGEVKKIPDVASVSLLGGRSRQIRVVLDKEKMAQTGVDFLSVSQLIGGSNAQVTSGNLRQSDQMVMVETGNFLTSADDIARLVVGVDEGQPVYLRQIAAIEDGPELPRQYLFFGYGASDTALKSDYPSDYQAVTLSVAKRKGADAMALSDEILAKVDDLRKDLIPDDIQVSTTRNYGATASQKVSELMLHLFIAIIAVTLFVALAMGWRGGLVVFLSVPVTFALTLFVYYFMDYTLNRITLFALVFVTGIVVDDSIIIAENMHRHFKMRQLPFMQAALYAINEVGNPTILATFTVIAAVLPMAFVSGMMGPYMSPMPIGASIAMLISLLVALTLTPYLGYLFLRQKDGAEVQNEEPQAVKESYIHRTYRRLISPLLESRTKRWIFMIATTVVLLGSLTLFFTQSVTVKMLPFDNKNELQVIIDMPEGTSLERTAAVAREMGAYLGKDKWVESYQAYVGTSAPISFNGLIRHYDMRSGNHVADIQVNFVDKHFRKQQSHDLAKALRPALTEIGKRHGANIKLAEVPPGPPVMSTLVAEIYGPDMEGQLRLAEEVKDLFQTTEGVVDVDWMVEADQPKLLVEVDREKAVKMGVAPAQVAQNVRAALSGMTVGTLHSLTSYQPVPIVLQLPEEEQTDASHIKGLHLVNAMGETVPVGSLAALTPGVEQKSINRKNQKRVVYVVADVAGRLESPFYAMNKISDRLNTLSVPEGYTLSEAYTRQPASEENYTLKWDGEWQITYEVFRDLGIAFVVVLLIIYLLIVGWFQNYTVPLVMLTAIPLSLIGIVLLHWAMGAYFSATSMIGFIALAGVMVRNSVLIIDFINIRLDEGAPLKQAIIEAGAVRTLPILLTAGGVALGALVILFDPIFQGLAVSLVGGTITSTFLTLIVVPLLYFKMMRGKSRLD